VRNDKNRDIFIPRTKTMATLFEVKTSCDTQSVYTAVGQLMLHGAVQRNAPQRVLVVPAAPEGPTARTLRRISVEVLVYEWQGPKPTFPDLERLLGIS